MLISDYVGWLKNMHWQRLMLYFNIIFAITIKSPFELLFKIYVRLIEIGIVVNIFKSKQKKNFFKDIFYKGYYDLKMLSA